MPLKTLMTNITSGINKEIKVNGQKLETVTNFNTWLCCILELREILLSIQTDFSLVNAAVACAILESISRLEPSSNTTKPSYFDLLVDATGVFCHQLGLLGTDLHAAGCGSFVKTLN